MDWRGPDFSYSRLGEDRLFLGQTVLSITGDPQAGIGDYHRSRSGRYEVLYFRRRRSRASTYIRLSEATTYVLTGQ